MAPPLSIFLPKVGKMKYAMKIILAISALLVSALFVGGCVRFGSFTEAAPWTYLEQSDAMLEAAIEGLYLYRVDGQESSNDWIELVDGRLSVVGFAGEAWTGEYGSVSFLHFPLFVPEVISGVTVYHTLRFMQLSATDKVRLSYEDRMDDFDNAIHIENGFESVRHDEFLEETWQQHYVLTRVEFSIHDGWLLAERVEEFENVFYPHDNFSGLLLTAAYATLGWERDFARHGSQGKYWLDVSEEEVFSLSGIAAGGEAESNWENQRGAVDFSRADYAAAVYVAVPNRLGAAGMYHLVRTYFLDDSYQKFFQENSICLSNWDIEIPVTLKDDRLVFAGLD